jgi:ribulose kinase
MWSILFAVFDEEAICHRMVLVCGTSTCHMAVSKKKLFIPGVWGPFLSGTVVFNILLFSSI